MSCAFETCAAWLASGARCAMVGGCVRERFGPQPLGPQNTLRPGAKALNGTQPRPSRDPAKIPRTRKALTR